MLIISGTMILLAFSPLPRALGKLLMHGRTPLAGQHAGAGSTAR